MMWWNILVNRSLVQNKNMIFIFLTKYFFVIFHLMKPLGSKDFGWVDRLVFIYGCIRFVPLLAFGNSPSLSWCNAPLSLCVCARARVSLLFLFFVIFLALQYSFFESFSVLFSCYFYVFDYCFHYHPCGDVCPSVLT